MNTGTRTGMYLFDSEQTEPPRPGPNSWSPEQIEAPVTGYSMTPEQAVAPYEATLTRDAGAVRRLCAPSMTLPPDGPQPAE